MHIWFALKRDIQKDLVPVILIYAQIMPGHAVRGMIVEFHEQRRLNTLPPGVIAKGFAERMAADTLFHSGSEGCFPDDAEGLAPADGEVCSLPAWEQVILCGRNSAKCV